MEEVEIYDMDAEPSLIARFFENDLLMYRSVLSRDRQYTLQERYWR